jgi:hypothetical protein
MNRLSILLALLCLVAIPAAADDVYVGTSTGDFGVFNTGTGTFSLIGSSSTVIYGLGFSGGTLYANDSGSSPNTGFYTVNTTTGVLTPVANISGSTSGTGALTAPIGGGTLYYFDHSSQLFSINPTSGAATVIGPLGFNLNGNWDITFASNGNLYGTSNGYFYQINPLTGAATLLGYNGDQMQGLVGADGGVYGFAGNEMFSLNLTSGAATFVMDTPAGVGNFETGTEVPNVTTPEPATLVNLAVGLLLFATLVLWFKPQIRAV